MCQEPSHFPIPSSFDPIKYYQLFMIMHQAWVCSLFLLFLKCTLAHLRICSFSSSSTEPLGGSKTFCNPGVGRVLDTKLTTSYLCTDHGNWMPSKDLLAYKPERRYPFGGFHALHYSLPKAIYPCSEIQDSPA